MGFLRAVLIVGLALTMLGARAADTSSPVFQPPADWVKPAKLDPTPSKLAKDAPTAVLLHDYQIRFQPETTESYYEVVTKAQTPQGLQNIGSVALSWDPAIQRLIIHKLKVIRNGAEIDYLADGPGFLTLRRETKLEAATLDGTLTATTQLEGLEVGDIVDLAYTIENTDPIMKGHVQADLGLAIGPVRKFHLRFSWPSSMVVAWRALSHAQDLALRTKDGWTEAVLERDDPVDPLLPKSAPPRYLRGPELQASNFTGWADVSALLSGEFAEAERLKPASSLKAEADAIAARTSDPKARAEAALTLVQDKIRYVLLAFDGGGLKPAAADLTWSRRFADCKGKTVALLALLHALGIEAEPVLASQEAGDGLDQRMPLLAVFDHALVKATIDGRVYWLDGTRTGDHALDQIRTPPFHWALPVRAAGGELIKLDAQDFSQPQDDVTLRLDASPGLTLPAPAHGEMLLRGDAAVAYNLAISSLSSANLEAALKEFWRRSFPYIDIKSASAHFDAAAGEERLVMDGSATLDWKTGGGYEVSELEYKRADFQRQPGPDEDAPVLTAFPRFDRQVVLVTLPNLGGGFTLVGDQVDEVDAGIHFVRSLALEKGVFRGVSEAHVQGQEVTRAEAAAAAKRMTDLSKRAVRIVTPIGGISTSSERDALEATTPETAGEYINRGNARLNDSKYDLALADFDQAVTLNPASSIAWADRAMARAWKGDYAKAQADWEQALVLEPKQIIAFHAKGLTAVKEKHWSDAVMAFTSALAIQPQDVFSLQERAEANLRLYRYKDALNDAEAGLAIYPLSAKLATSKCTALVELDRPDEAASLARSMITDHPGDAYALLRAARMLHFTGDYEEAWASIDQAVSLKPVPEILLARADMHPFGNLEQGSQDAKRALQQDEKSKDALLTLAKLNYWARNYAEALKWGGQALERSPDDTATLGLIGAQHHALGDDTAAAADYARLRKLAGADGDALYRLCWSEATVGYDLPGAMADCEASLRAWPDYPPSLTGRGLVLLRLGRDAEAVAAFDTALLARSNSSYAWFGRGLAERRLGRVEEADRDRDEAIRRQKNIEAWFSFYGMPG